MLGKYVHMCGRQGGGSEEKGWREGSSLAQKAGGVVGSEGLSEAEAVEGSRA